MTLQQLGPPGETTSVHDADSTLARCALAGTMAVFFYEPGVLQEGLAGEMEGEPVTMGMALLNAAMVALPLAMAAATLFLPIRASAIISLVVGVPLGAFGLFAVANHLAECAWHAHLTLAALATAIAWLIVGLSIAELRRRSHSGTAPGAVRVDSEARGA